MTGTAICRECEAGPLEFSVPKDSVNPVQRRGLQRYLDDLRKVAAMRHRRLTTCRSSRFDITFALEPRINR